MSPRIEEGLYDRQESLPLRIPNSIAIVGVGGVGSWVAYFFALVGVASIMLIDPDRVEEHNRNRTPFHVWHPGEYKCDALLEVILECREDCQVETYNKRYEELSPVEKQRIDNAELFFDCRDVISELDRQTPITGGYDGSEVTLHIKPDYRKVFSANEQEGYRVTPSYVVPPVFIALNIVNYICLERWQRGGNMDEFCFNVDMTKLVRKLAGKKRFRPRGTPNDAGLARGGEGPENSEPADHSDGSEDDDNINGIPVRRGISLESTRFLPFEVQGTLYTNGGEVLYRVLQMQPSGRLVSEIIDEEGMRYLSSGRNL
jgi:hypothetical protein